MRKIYIILVIVWSCICSMYSQDTMESAVNIGSKGTGFEYTNTLNTSLYTNKFGAGPNDVFYKFTLTKSMDIVIHHCGSVLYHTYLYVLSSTGSILYSCGYNWSEGECTNTYNAYLAIDKLPAGTYYVVSEGYSENGIITTTIKGNNPIQSLTPSSNHNYIITSTPLVETTDVNKIELDKKLVEISYFDGLGRPVQTVQQGITPTKKDLVTLQEYDSFGRELSTWLPALTAESNYGAYVSPTTIKQKAIELNSNDQKPYSKAVYEQSPLNRVLAQYGPGASWQDNGKAVKYIYGTNVGGSQPASTVELNNADEPSGVVTACDRITLKPGFQFAATAEKSMTLAIDPSQCSQASVQSLAATDAEQIDPALLTCNYYKVANNQLSRSGSYQGGQLYVTQVSDEDGNKSLEFKDKLGQVVLTRQVNGSEKYDTYYVYDDFGNLCYVLPPLAVDKGVDLSDNSDVMKQYAYLYQYDDRNRCIRKRLPGTEWISYVYDKADRLIFTQDGEQANKSPKEWTFNKYDAFGRLILSGIHKTNESHATLIGRCKDIVVIEKASGTASWGYTWNVLPGYITNEAVLVANYYDDYDLLLDRNASFRTKLDYTAKTGYGIRYIDSQMGMKTPKGLLVGTRIKQFLSDGSIGSNLTGEIITAIYYDIRGRVIQTKSTNHLGGVDEEYIAYNFTGQPTQKLHIHKATGKTTQTELYTYAYDHAGRLTETKHKLNNNAEVVLAKNEYDELGRLKTNTKNNKDNLKTLYTYNVRSWTKSISTPLFNQTLYYNDKVTAHTYTDYVLSYNGNISGMEWQHGIDPKQSNRFKYDALSRLRHSAYNGVTSGGNYNTSYAYDKHGNVQSLVRQGKLDNVRFNVIDNLEMTYTGNQLKNVHDKGVTVDFAASEDFKDYSIDATKAKVEYAYNRNGAMVKDLNKGITQIKYNSLNLPMEIQVSNDHTQGWNKYLYTASGVKLRVESQSAAAMQSAPVLGTLANVYSTSINKKTDYVGNIIYENDNLKRILVDGGYWEDEEYHFYLTDHLGNNRVVVKADGTTIVQKSDYYPFGMSIADNTGSEAQPYKYNGKELDKMHGLNLYDYSARHYDATIPRFTTVDPLAEKHYGWSPYVYCLNNPLKYIDPLGMDTIYINESGKRQGDIKRSDTDVIYVVDKNGNIKATKDFNRAVFNRDKDGNADYGKIGNTGYDYYQLDNSGDAEEFFEFIADNTGVEWSNMEFKDGSNYLTTAHNEGVESSSAYALETIFENKTLVKHVHNHPGPGREFPSGEPKPGYAIDERGNDVKFAMRHTRFAIHYNRRPLPKFSIYKSPKDSSTGAKQYISYPRIVKR